MERTGKLAWLAALLLLILAPFVGVYPIFVMTALCFAIFAMAFNLLLGYTGLLSFGHAAFFGGAAYVTGWLVHDQHWTPELGLVAGTVAAGLTGLVVGLIAIRRQGIYFAMVTLALAQMLAYVLEHASFTGGEDGIQGIQRGKLFGLISLDPDLSMYVLVAVVFIAGFLVIHRIVHSPFGQVLKAIRENEPRATSLGYRTDDYKLMAFVLSCFVAGIAGGMKSLVFGIATLTDVHNSTSGDVVLMTLLGGLGTIFGPVVGATIIQTLEQYLAQFGSWVTVTQGVIFVICVLAFRRGIVGEIANRLKIGL
jgi:branched-chain amino acid transport system permease protein